MTRLHIRINDASSRIVMAKPYIKKCATFKLSFWSRESIRRTFSPIARVYFSRILINLLHCSLRHRSVRLLRLLSHVIQGRWFGDWTHLVVISDSCSELPFHHDRVNEFANLMKWLLLVCFRRDNRFWLCHRVDQVQLLLHGEVDEVLFAGHLLQRVHEPYIFLLFFMVNEVRM